MPLVKPILIGTSIVLGAGVALYEANPTVRRFVDAATVNLSLALQDLVDAIDDGLRGLTPQQREERRRRQRRRIAMLSAPQHAAAHDENAPGSSERARDRVLFETDPAAGASTGLPEDAPRAKRRRLYEIAEAITSHPAAHVAAVEEVALPAVLARPKSLADSGAAVDVTAPRLEEAVDVDADADAETASTASFSRLSTPAESSVLESAQPELSVEAGAVPAVPEHALAEPHWEREPSAALDTETISDASSDADTESLTHMSGASVGGEDDADADADVISVASTADTDDSWWREDWEQ